jgi:ISXO2-like transposase domain
MTEFFVRDRKSEDVMYELKLASECVCNWRSFFREVCMDMLLNEAGMIGGVGKIVEIDESKFGKRKYNRGRRVEGRWVLGGVERGSKKCFLRVVEQRDKDTLVGIIKASVLPGTTIITD